LLTDSIKDEEQRHQAELVLSTRRRKQLDDIANIIETEKFPIEPGIHTSNEIQPNPKNPKTNSA
jgi:hypothetical protein